jgi:hypothetical protein
MDSPPAAKKSKKSVARAVPFSTPEKVALAEVFVEKRQILKGKKKGASKSDTDPKKEIYEDAAKTLTAMGISKRTPEQIQQKISDMEKKVMKLISKEVGIYSVNSSTHKTAGCLRIRADMAGAILFYFTQFLFFRWSGLPPFLLYFRDQILV